jgi:hypothetical protein
LSSGIAEGNGGEGRGGETGEREERGGSGRGGRRLVPLAWQLTLLGVTQQRGVFSTF